MADSTHLNSLLSRLKPLDELPHSAIGDVRWWKRDFPDPERKLHCHLKTLGVPQLEEYLSWINPSLITKIEQIGEGAFAKVYKGTIKAKSGDSDTQGVFAMKELNTSMLPELVLNIILTTMPDDISTTPPSGWKSRAGLSPILQDPGTGGSPTIPIFGLSQYPGTGRYLMVMEYADSGTLERVARPFPNHWSEIARESKLLAERLATLHGLGFTHGDLHPGNVVFIKVEHVNSPYLIDVGLSRSVEDGQGEKGVYGRQDYLPPEIFQGASHTRASDIYCFGTLLWQSIIGVPPRGTARTAVKRFPDGLREELIPGAPEYLNEILKQTWNPIPTNRPSMHQVIDRLQMRESYGTFSEETLAFIAQRKAEYDLEKTYSASSRSVSSCSTSSSIASAIPLRKSQFHSLASLRTTSIASISPVHTKFCISTTANSIPANTSPAHVNPSSFLDNAKQAQILKWNQKHTSLQSYDSSTSCAISAPTSTVGNEQVDSPSFSYDFQRSCGMFYDPTSMVQGLGCEITLSQSYHSAEIPYANPPTNIVDEAIDQMTQMEFDPPNRTDVLSIPKIGWNIEAGQTTCIFLKAGSCTAEVFSHKEGSNSDICSCFLKCSCRFDSKNVLSHKLSNDQQTVDNYSINMNRQSLRTRDSRSVSLRHHDPPALKVPFRPLNAATPIEHEFGEILASASSNRSSIQYNRSRSRDSSFIKLKETLEAHFRFPSPPFTATVSVTREFGQTPESASGIGSVFRHNYSPLNCASISAFTPSREQAIEQLTKDLRTKIKQPQDYLLNSLSSRLHLSTFIQATPQSLNPSAQLRRGIRISIFATDNHNNREHLQPSPPIMMPLLPDPVTSLKDMLQIICTGDLEHNFGVKFLGKPRKNFCVLTSRHLLRFKDMPGAAATFNIDASSFANQSRQSVASVRPPSSSIMVATDSIFAVQDFISTMMAIRVDHVHPQTKVPTSMMLTNENTNNLTKWYEAIRSVAKRHLESDHAIAIKRLRPHADIPDVLEQMIVHKVFLNERRQGNGNLCGVKKVALPVLLVIGMNNFYILPTLSDDADYKNFVSKDYFGLMAISSIAYKPQDDAVQVTVRIKGSKSKILSFTSSLCEAIVHDLRRAINTLVQLYPQPLCDFYIQHLLLNIPIRPWFEIANLEDCGFDKLLAAHCAALSLDKQRFSFNITEIVGVAGARKITVNPPNESKKGTGDVPYNRYELLAIFRSLRHNTIFHEISFANSDLSEMEKWIPNAEDGWAATKSPKTQNQAMLSSELYSMIIGNKNLRKLDLTNCNIGTTGTPASALSAIGRAMQTGELDLSSIFIGQNLPTQKDLYALIAGIKKNREAIKELSLANCQLEQQQINLLLDTFITSSPDHFDMIDISNNQSYVNPEKIDLLLRKAKNLKTLRIRKADFPIESLMQWVTNLRHLDVGGTRLNNQRVSALCSYVRSKAFNNLEILSIDDCCLNGFHFQDIFQSIYQSCNSRVHLNAGSNPICKENGSLVKFYQSILQSEGPSSLSLARTEWDDTSFSKLLECLRTNNVIRHLDLAYIHLSTKLSEDTVRKLAALLEHNKTLEELILAGEETLLGHVGLGKLIAEAFPSLAKNTTLKKLNVTGNLIGDAGALHLAEMLKTNKTLKSLEMDGSKMTIAGFKSILEAMSNNSTLTHISRPIQDLKYQIQYQIQLFGSEFKSSFPRATKFKFDNGILARLMYHRMGNVTDQLYRLVQRNRRIEMKIEETDEFLH